MAESGSRFLPHAERLVWLGFMAFLLITTMIYIHRGMGLERDVQQAQREALDLQMQLMQRQSMQVVAPADVGLTGGQVLRLQRLGLADPVQRLTEDLLSQPELIGLTEDAWDFLANDVNILNDRWVLAGISDGQRSGTMLLEFEVAFGRIQWQVLGTVLD